MAESTNKYFEWKEVCDLFCIRESEKMQEAERNKIMNRINKVTDEYGRDYVIRKIALVTQ